MIRTFTAAALVSFTLFAAAAIAQDASTSATSTKPATSSATAPATPAPAAVNASSSSTAATAPAKPAKPFVYEPKEYDVATGSDKAPVTIVEYASLSCPHCSHFYAQSLPELTSKYIDTNKVKFVFRSFPLNDPALKAAQLVACADPDRRHAFIKVLFTTQAKWAYDSGYRDALGNIAVLGGVDRLKFESCMNDKTLEKKAIKVAKEASDDYNVNSTPSFFINGEFYKGDHDAASMSKVIDQVLAKGGKN